jgi:hypothetical protein
MGVPTSRAGIVVTTEDKPRLSELREVTWLLLLLLLVVVLWLAAAALLRP